MTTTKLEQFTTKYPLFNFKYFDEFTWLQSYIKDNPKKFANEQQKIELQKDIAEVINFMKGKYNENN